MVGGEAEQLRERFPLPTVYPRWLPECACPAGTPRDYNPAQLALSSVSVHTGDRSMGCGFFLDHLTGEARRPGAMDMGGHVECCQFALWDLLSGR